jgi:hypothetical protein
MASRYWFVGPLEDFLDRLPRAIARPISSFIVLLYFHCKLIGVGSAVAAVAGVLGYVLWDDLPPGESKTALFLLIGLALFAVWQWSEASRLRERLRSLEEELREEDTQYEYPDGSPVED